MRRRPDFRLGQRDAAENGRQVTDRRRNQREEHDRHKGVDEWNEVELHEAELLEHGSPAAFAKGARAFTGHCQRPPVDATWTRSRLMVAVCIERAALVSEIFGNLAIFTRSSTWTMSSYATSSSGTTIAASASGNWRLMSCSVAWSVSSAG